MRSVTSRRSGAALIGISLLAYLAIGLPEGMLGVAWPSMSKEFGVTIPSLGLLLTILTVGYGSGAVASGKIVNRFGPGNAMTAFAAVAVAGVIGYTLAPNWFVMLGCALVTGYGVGGLDGGLNSYAALRFSSVTTNWIHGFFAIGASIGPAVMTGILVVGGNWQLGYVIAGSFFAVVTMGFLRTRTRWSLDAGDVPNPVSGHSAARMSTTLRLRQTWYGIGLFALYAGVEVAVGQWTFTVLTQSRDVSTGAAGTWVTAYYVGLTLGRLGIGSLTGIFPPNRVMRVSLAAAIVAATIFWMDIAPWTGFIATFALGLCLGPVFPSLISTTPERVGRAHTSNLVGFQITGAAAGVAIIPGGFGLVARLTGVGAIPAAIAMLTVALLILFLASERVAEAGHK